MMQSSNRNFKHVPVTISNNKDTKETDVSVVETGCVCVVSAALLVVSVVLISVVGGACVVVLIIAILINLSSTLTNQ